MSSSNNSLKSWFWEHLLNNHVLLRFKKTYLWSNDHRFLFINYLFCLWNSLIYSFIYLQNTYTFQNVPLLMLLPRMYYWFLSFMIYLICKLLAVFTFTLAPCLYKLQMVKTFLSFFFVPENCSYHRATVLHLDQSNRGPPHQSKEGETYTIQIIFLHHKCLAQLCPNDKC